MAMGNVTQRTVEIEGIRIPYELERKRVKNLNLRVRRDGSVYVSANSRVPLKQIDAFLISKGAFIREAQKRFEEQMRHRPQPKQYISGETFFIQGRALCLKVSQSDRDRIYSDGEYLFLETKDPTDFAKKERMVLRYLDQQAAAVFHEVMEQISPAFEKYGVAMPKLRIRSMNTRWGSCLTNKGIITLNKCLLGAPRRCIEYVVMHEFCHFIHPNHSKQYYAFLSMQMPDWKERKKTLEESMDYL